jgi:hypothetical protein
MSLNRDQIEQIKKFIHSRGFTHIEVEMEILDHVATAVEEALQKHPQKPLHRAIKEIHASFGVMGFSHFEDQKIKMVGRLIRSAFIEKFFSFFATKRFLTTALIGLLYWTITFQTWIGSIETMRWAPFVILGCLVAGFAIINNYWKYYRLHKKSIMMGNSVFFFAVIPSLGNGLGIVFEQMIQNGYPNVEPLFILLMTVSTLVTLAMNDTAKWAYNWTYERYLKYA